MHTKLWSENRKGRDYVEDLGVDRKMILERKRLASDRDPWWDPVNTLMNLRVP
jgi:hypothetical protein